MTTPLNALSGMVLRSGPFTYTRPRLRGQDDLAAAVAHGVKAALAEVGWFFDLADDGYTMLWPDGSGICLTCAPDEFLAAFERAVRITCDRLGAETVEDEREVTPDHAYLCRFRREVST